MYAVMGLEEAFRTPYLIPDDARQHVFWTQQFADRELFPNDYIASYYQSIAPAGYALIYRAAAAIGIHPLLFNKLLPAAIILLTSIATFWTSLELFPVPVAAFFASLLMDQAVSITDTVSAGTAKAFVYLVTVALMYAWLRRSIWLSWLAILLQGLLYPQAVLISAGILALGLVEWREGRLRLSGDRHLWKLSLGGLAIAVVVLLPYLLSSSGYGPTISAAEALTMPEFQSGGRVAFFRDDPAQFWLRGRSGIRINSALTPVTNAAGFLLLFLPGFPQQFPLVGAIDRGIGILPRLFLSSACWFLAAHALLFALYLPSRYSGHYLRILFVLSAGIALLILIDALLRWAILALDRAGSPQRALEAAIASTTAAALVGLLLFYPLTIRGFPLTFLAQAQSPELYSFLESQPKDSLIATLSHESSYIPSFARRSILVGKEYAIPYQTGYYREIRQRAKDTIAAQYSPNPQVVREFIERYGITLWLLDRDAFQPQGIASSRWVQQYQPEAAIAVETLTSGQTPALAKTLDRCSAFKSENHRILKSECILAALEES